jgi:hypothetical protein
MSRINVYGPDNTLAGWFDPVKAARWTDADHNGNGSGGTGRGQAIYRTAGGRWVMEQWTLWQGESSYREFTDPGTAREWLLRNGYDEDAAKHFGDIEEERGPGRPRIGGEVLLRLGDDLLTGVDAYAGGRALSRAEAVRSLLSRALSSEN